MWCSHKSRKDTVAEGLSLDCQHSRETGESLFARCPLSLSPRELPTRFPGSPAFQLLRGCEGRGIMVLETMLGRTNFSQQAPCIQLAERKAMLSCTQRHAHPCLNKAKKADFTTANPSLCCNRSNGT